MRDYKDEYRKFQSSPAQKKARAGRNAARKKLGLKKGDPRDAAHVKDKNGKVTVVAKHYSKNRGSKSDMPGDRAARGGKYKKIKK
jgi:hypothetical protein